MWWRGSDGTFCRGVQLLGLFLAGGVRVVPSHGDETVCVHVAHSAHVESGHHEVHSQLAHITNSHGWLRGANSKKERSQTTATTEFFLFLCQNQRPEGVTWGDGHELILPDVNKPNN